MSMVSIINQKLFLNFFFYSYCTIDILEPE